MNLNEKFKLRTNPFRNTPAVSAEEIVWAGFPELKQKFERRIQRSIRIPNSTLVLNWGEYGSGKTHAARFFNKSSELQRIAGDAKIPYSMVMPLPKGKDPVQEIYTSVIDQLDIDKLRTDFSSVSFDINGAIEAVTSNLQIQAVLKAIFNDKADSSFLKKYLYGSTSNADLKHFTSHNIQRNLKGDTDYTNLLAGLFTCLTFNKDVYSSVVIWLDEFESIAILSSSNIDRVNVFLREIMDNTPNNLLIFLNLTQTALLGVSDLGDYIYESVKSRIRDTVNFEIPSSTAFKVYLTEILQAYRTDTDTNPYFPFEEAVVDNIFRELGNVSLRTFNDTFSLLLDLADMDNVDVPVSITSYEKFKPELIGWKNE